MSIFSLLYCEYNIDMHSALTERHDLFIECWVSNVQVQMIILPAPEGNICRFLVAEKSIPRAVRPNNRQVAGCSGEQ